MKYRLDIDGLRAVAVLAVVFYHCGFSRFLPGGFIGVDIFFVISGYLITGIIHRELDAGQFHIAKFYERRVRRIIPALLVMVLTTVAAAFFLTMPSTFVEISDGAISALLSVSNIYFFNHSGYFDAASASHPMLHTWSLAVEEQYYVVLPLLMFVVASSQRWMILSIGCIALLSLALSQWLLRVDASAAYYLPYSRAWELLIGSFVAVARLPAPGRIAANILTMSGAAAIAASMFWINSRTPFPGLAALPACAGVAAILYAGESSKTLVSWGLSLPPARFIGLISYSLYLWHWPIWVLGAEIFEPRSVFDRVAYICLMILAGFLSWRIVERPFRRTTGSDSPTRAIVSGIAAVLIVTVVAFGLRQTAGAFWQVPEAVEKVAAFSSHDINNAIRTGKCFLTSNDSGSAFNEHECLHLSTEKPNVLLVGDSHAAHLFPGLSQLSQINVLQATAAGCKPLLTGSGNQTCIALIDHALKDFLPRNHVDTILLSARWSSGDVGYFPDLLQNLKRYARRVIVIGPTVEYTSDLPKLLATGLYRKDPSYADNHRSSEPAAVEALLEPVVTGAGAEYISMIDTVCPGQTCTQWSPDGNPLQFDYGHFSERGSQLIVKRLEDVLGR